LLLSDFEVNTRLERSFLRYDYQASDLSARTVIKNADPAAGLL